MIEKTDRKNNLKQKTESNKSNELFQRPEILQSKDKKFEKSRNDSHK